MNRTAVWALTDQGLSGLSNIMLFGLVVRSTHASELGNFSLLFGIYSTALALQRSTVGSAVLIRPKAAGQDSAVIRLSVMSGAIWAVAALCVSRWLSVPLILVATLTAALPVLLLQDILRYVRLRDGEAHIAALADAVWCLVTLALFFIAATTWRVNATVLVCGWVLGGVTACGCLVLSRSAPSWRGGIPVREWLSTRRTLAGGLGLDALIFATGGYASAAILVATSGPAALAQLRAADTLMAPLASLTAALGIVILPRLSRARVHGPLILRLALALGCGSLAYCAILLVLPDSFGRGLLGQNWKIAREVLPILAVGYITGSVAVPLVSHLKARELVRIFLRLRLAATAGDAGGMIGGGVVAGGFGAAIGLTASRVISFVLCLAWAHSASMASRERHSDRGLRR